MSEPPTVSWYLEPSYCHFDFRETDNLIVLSVSTSEQATSNELTGTFEEIIYPIYREPRKFGSAEHTELHWPSIPRTRFEELKEAVKKRA